MGGSFPVFKKQVFSATSEVLYLSLQQILHHDGKFISRSENDSSKAFYRIYIGCFMVK